MRGSGPSASARGRSTRFLLVRRRWQPETSRRKQFCRRISFDSLVYDARGKIDTATSTNFGTATITTMYDGLGAVIGEETNSTADGTTQESFLADAMGNRLRKRMLTDNDDMVDYQHQRLLEYDGVGKLTRTTTPSNLPQHYMHTESYSYDSAGNTTLAHTLVTQDMSAPDHVSAASYYSADNKLRVFNKRIGVGTASDDSQPGKRGTLDEYWYDALGRRIFTRSRKVGSGCPTSVVDCSPTATVGRCLTLIFMLAFSTLILFKHKNYSPSPVGLFTKGFMLASKELAFTTRPAIERGWEASSDKGADRFPSKSRLPTLSTRSGKRCGRRLVVGCRHASASPRAAPWVLRQRHSRPQLNPK